MARTPRDQKPSEMTALHLQQQAAAVSAGLPALMLAATRVADQVQFGSHGRRRAGVGETFWQYRPYSPGEAAANIDWRQSARRDDQLFVREREWEAAQTLLVWADHNPSMTFRSAQILPTKAMHGRTAALALCQLAVRAGELIAPLDGSLRPSGSLHATEALAGLLLRGNSINDSDGEWPQPLKLQKHARALWVTDALTDPALIKARLAQFAAANVSGIMLRPVDPVERDFPYKGRVLMQGRKEGRRLLLSRADAVRDAYIERLQSHEATLKTMLSAAGWQLLTLPTDQSLLAPVTQAWRLLSDDRSARR